MKVVVKNLFLLAVFFLGNIGLCVASNNAFWLKSDRGKGSQFSTKVRAGQTQPKSKNDYEGVRTVPLGSRSRTPESTQPITARLGAVPRYQDVRATLPPLPVSVVPMQPTSLVNISSVEQLQRVQDSINKEYDELRQASEQVAKLQAMKEDIARQREEHESKAVLKQNLVVQAENEAQAMAERLALDKTIQELALQTRLATRREQQALKQLKRLDSEKSELQHQRDLFLNQKVEHDSISEKERQDLAIKKQLFESQAASVSQREQQALQELQVLNHKKDELQKQDTLLQIRRSEYTNLSEKERQKLLHEKSLAEKLTRNSIRDLAQQRKQHEEQKGLHNEEVMGQERLLQAKEVAGHAAVEEQKILAQAQVQQSALDLEKQRQLHEKEIQDQEKRLQEKHALLTAREDKIAKDLVELQAQKRALDNKAQESQRSLVEPMFKLKDWRDLVPKESDAASSLVNQALLSVGANPDEPVRGRMRTSRFSKKQDGQQSEISLEVPQKGLKVGSFRSSDPGYQIPVAPEVPSTASRLWSKFQDAGAVVRSVSTNVVKQVRSVSSDAARRARDAALRIHEHMGGKDSRVHEFSNGGSDDFANEEFR